MRILTWNINSVRLRMPLVRKLISDCDPDIICLQETKTPDEHFPQDEIMEEGYPHIHFHGMKSYNGVAIISRLPFASNDVHHRAGREDCRHISINLEIQNNIENLDIHCLYIPAGGDEPDPEINEKFAHKLEFIDELGEWFNDNYNQDQPLIALGDFNIAPLENDVWSHKQLLRVVSHTPVEVERLEKMQKSLDWHDAIRHFIPEEEKCYTWWSYRNRDWKKSNRGRRLDHIWVTKHKTASEAPDGA
jgi:exodeoxyribonuclease-3